MTDTTNPGLATRLSHGGRPRSRERSFVNPAVERGSTVLYPDMADRRATQTEAARLGQSMTYGMQGSRTHHMLEDLVAEVEGGTRCQIVSSGLAACTTALLAFLKAGDHCLLPDSVYGPTRSFAEHMLRDFGVEVAFYAPTLAEAELAALMRPNTRVLFAESPGSHTFEMQDVPALARVAHAGGAVLLLDNTWGFGTFLPFRHGVDVSIQALTKYAGGHSDLLLGSLTVADEAVWKPVRNAAMMLGQYASPDDCWLALRGLRTLAARLERQMASGLTVARWFREQPEVAEVLHPALPGAPGHDLWRRDYSGACSLFGVRFRPDIPVEATHALADALTLFGLGASWGGFESLVLPTTGFIRRTEGDQPAGALCRFHIGLEDPADLIADLARGFGVLRSAADG